MKIKTAIFVCALISGIALCVSGSAYAGYTVAGCSETGAIGIVGNATQDIATLTVRAIDECQKNKGTNCQTICSGDAGGFVAIARGRNESTNAIGLGCSQQDSRNDAKSEAIDQCSQVGGNACKVIRTFEAK